MARRPFTIAALAAAALVLAACGGSDEADVESSIDGYLTALAEGDAAAVCELIDTSTVSEVGSQESCEAVYSSGFELLADRQVELPDYEITDVAIDGDTATVALDFGGSGQEVELTEDGDGWRLHGETAIGQFHPDLVPGQFP